jgi:predicted DNA-binding protein (UPF0251 family)
MDEVHPTPSQINLRKFRDRRAVGDYPDVILACDVLNGRQLQAALLVWDEGKTQTEAARIMGISQARVHQLLKSAEVRVIAALVAAPRLS